MGKQNQDVGAQQSLARVMWLLSFEIVFGVIWNFIWALLFTRFPNFEHHYNNNKAECQPLINFSIFHAVVCWVFFLVFAAIVAIIVNANFKSDTKTLMNFPDIKKSITTVFIITCYLSVIFIILYAGFHDGPITDYREKCGDIYQLIKAYFDSILFTTLISILVGGGVYIFFILNPDEKYNLPEYPFLGHSYKKPYGSINM